MWTKEQAANWAAKQPWIVGFNYVPAYAVNSTEMWQQERFDPKAIARELARGAQDGYNACRVFLPFILWQHQHDAFMENLERFLTIADKNGMVTVPIFFDDCAFSHQLPYLGPQREPVPGIHNSGWTPSPGPVAADDPACQEALRQYVTELCQKYGQDRRILFWEMYNEPGNSGRGHACEALLRDAFHWAREAAPSQPLTAAAWSWSEYDPMCLELSDIVAFHDYNSIDSTREHVRTMETLGRPVFCTEWLHREAGSTFESHLPFYQEHGIGVFQWGLVTGRTQTYLNWDAEKNPKEGMPALWQHDVYDKNLRPYREEEMALLRRLTGK